MTEDGGGRGTRSERLHAAELQRHFDALREADAAARARSLEALARDDQALAARLVTLLRHHDELSSFLETPPAARVDGLAVEPPPQVGAYRLVRELGRGATGVVWLAEQERPRRTVALKLLRWDAPGAEASARFVREAEVLARIDHPACARVIEAGVLRGSRGGHVPWIAMVYVAGRPLRDAVEGWPRERVLALFERVADGVQAAHDAGVIHRDLKPANVLVGDDGSPVVLDFGVARLVADDDEAQRTASGVLIGTPAYMAPEQASGERARVDVRSDVWALGVLLYEALSGELPLETRGVSAVEALRRVADGEPRPLSAHLPGVPRDVELVVSKALERDPERRYPSARAFAADLRAIRQRRPVGARPPSIAYQARCFVERNRALAASLALTITGLGGGLAVTLAALERSRESEARALVEEAGARRLVDLLMVGELERVTEELWPATPESVGELDRWVTTGSALRERLAADLALLAAEPDAVARSEREPLERARAYFEDGGGAAAGFAALELRRERAHGVFDATITAHREAWAAARARVLADARFDGLELAPQVGLVPLGPDPRSGLEEFAHWVWTGSTPGRDAATGELVLDDDNAVVLVLVPGGEAVLGHQADDPDAPRYYAEARWHEPVHTVRLDPFLIAKHEFTQGQWTRLGLENPSYFSVGDVISVDAVLPRHPVETVSWEVALEAARRLGLTLPTEAQFEHANRAGTDTPWWSGADLESLAGGAHNWLTSRDATFLHGGRERSWSRDNVFAPAGVHEPNPWGLHDTSGNYIEWCLDVYWTGAGAAVPRRPGDGLAVHPDPAAEADNPHRCLRGGFSGGDMPYLLSCGMRTDGLRWTANQSIGFRVARSLDRSVD